MIRISDGGLGLVIGGHLFCPLAWHLGLLGTLAVAQLGAPALAPDLGEVAGIVSPERATLHSPLDVVFHGELVSQAARLGCRPAHGRDALSFLW